MLKNIFQMLKKMIAYDSMIKKSEHPKVNNENNSGLRIQAALEH